MEKNDLIWREADGGLSRTHLIPLPGGKSQVWKYYGMFSQDGVRILPQHSSKVYCLVPGCANPEMVYCGNTTNLYGHLQRKHPDVIQPQKRAFLTKVKVKPGAKFPNHKKYLKLPAQRYARKTRRVVPKEEDFSMDSMSTGQLVEHSSADIIDIHYDDAHYDEQNNVAHNQYTVSNSLSVDLQEGTGDLILVEGNEVNQTELRFVEIENQVPERKIECSNQGVQTGVEDEDHNLSPLLKNEHITEALLDLMVSDLSGSELLQRPGFQCFLNTIYPRYDLPSRETVQTSLKSRYHACKSALQSHFKSVKLVAVTTNVWTSKYDGRKYAQLSASYIDSDWQLRTRSFANVAADYGYNEDARLVLEEFCLSTSKLVSVTSNSGSTLSFDDVPSCICLATALDEAFQSAIELEAVEQLRKLCLNPNLLSMAENPRLKWSSVFQILDNIVRSSNDVSETLRGVHSLLGNILKILNVLYDASSRASLFVPLLAQIRNMCSNPTGNDHFHKIAAEVQRYLDNVYNDPTIIRFLEKCTFLDPRFKDFDIFCNKAVLQKEILDEMNLHVDVPNIEFVNDNCLKDLFGSLPKSKLKSPEQKMTSELEYYMDFQTANYEENPVHWWKKHHAYLPTLSRLAQKYLCVPIKVVKNCDLSVMIQPDPEILFLNSNSDLIKKGVLDI